MTTGMITSFSVPGFPSEFSFRIPFVSWGAKPLATARVGETAAETPKAESTDANLIANILRVELTFMDHSFSLKFCCYQGNVKLKMSLPAATATYCFPFMAYVIGDALELCPVVKCQSGLPVCPSTASNDPASSAKNRRPLAVVIVPPDECPVPVCGYFQASVAGSRLYASRLLYEGSPGIRFTPVE